MANSAITTQVAQLKIGSIQNQADSTSVYSNGVWSFKNSTAVASVTITDAGNVGIGTSSPAVPLDVVASNANALHLKLRGRASDSVGQMEFWNNANSTRYGYIGADSASVNFSTNGALPLLFGTNAAERMRIDASGSLLVGQTTGGSYRVGIEAGSSTGIRVRTSATNLTAINTAGSGATFCYFQSDTTEMGKIVQNGASAVTYSTTSDYRLKKDVQPLVNALSRISALKPCTYKWKIDDSQSEGFIAHELAEVCPEAVVGEKDAVNEDGSIKVQGIDPSKLVALLTAAIQELSAKNDALEARLAALEAK